MPDITYVDMNLDEAKDKAILHSTYMLSKLFLLKESYPRTLSLPEGTQIAYDIWSLSLTMPYSIPALADLTLQLADQGWKCERKNFDKTQGILTATFEKETNMFDPKYGFRLTISLMVRLDTKLDGSTCKLNKIGTREVPVYETLCLAADGSLLQDPPDLADALSMEGLNET